MSNWLIAMIKVDGSLRLYGDESGNPFPTEEIAFSEAKERFGPKGWCIIETDPIPSQQEMAQTR